VVVDDGFIWVVGFVVVAAAELPVSFLVVVGFVVGIVVVGFVVVIIVVDFVVGKVVVGFVVVVVGVVLGGLAAVVVVVVGLVVVVGRVVVVVGRVVVVVVVVVVDVGRVAFGKVSNSISLPQTIVAPLFASVVIHRSPLAELTPLLKNTTSICFPVDPASTLCSVYTQLDPAHH